MIMGNTHSAKSPEIDVDTYPEQERVVRRQLALLKFRRLKLLKKSELTLDEELFLENFEAATSLWWSLKL